MQTECNATLFGFAPVERREVVAGFDGGVITSDAGALLLRAADRTIGLMGRFARCFRDVRRAELIEEYKAEFANPYIAAERGYVDDVIEPRRTRAILVNALETALTKRERRPARKHGNIPL